MATWLTFDSCPGRCKFDFISRQHSLFIADIYRQSASCVASKDHNILGSTFYWGEFQNATTLEMLTKQIGKDSKWVFTYKGKPVTQATTKAWYKALGRAGIDNFRWHDLRHTWASWLTQQGVPLNLTQEMGAWESSGMVRRYAHLAPEQLSKHARLVDDLLNGTH